MIISEIISIYCVFISQLSDTDLVLNPEYSLLIAVFVTTAKVLIVNDGVEQLALYEKQKP